jgi:hypothetical protein
LIYTVIVAARVPAVHGARVRTTVLVNFVVSIITNLGSNFLAVSTDCSTAGSSAFRGGGAVPSRLLGTDAAATIPADGVVIIAAFVASKDPISTYCIAGLWC